MAGVLPIQKTTKMEKQFNSLEYFNDKVTDLELYNSEYKMIEEAFKEAKKMYAEEIIKAYNKGWDEAALQYHNY